MKVIKRDPDKGYVDSWLWIPRRWTNVNAVMSSLSFVFTDSYTGKQEVLYLWKETTHHLLVPRMLWPTSQLPFEVIDCRPQSFLHVDFKSRIKLDHRPATINGQDILTPTGDNVQRISLAALQAAMGGVLQLACGKGKTVVALEEIAEAKVPSIIVLDNTNLLEQWDREVHRLLDVPGGIGYIMSGKDDWEGRGIVLATYHSLAARADTVPEEFRRYFGRAYFDEGHHVSAPFFSRAATIFYCPRFALTATPERDDGWHIICDFHIGKVLHKDLRPTMKSQIVFYWTGFALDLTDPVVTRGVLDVNGEVHISKMRTFFGQWRPRLWTLMQAAIDAIAYGRKVLILCDSVDGVVNLMTMWTRGAQAQLYSEIPYPTTAEIGETLSPLSLTSDEAGRLGKRLAKVWEWVAKSHDPQKVAAATYEANDLMARWQQYLVHKKLEAEYERRQRQFIKQLIDEPSTAGFMTYGVPAKTRQRFLDERQVVFAITKYGKEGLDCPALDTVLVSDLFSSRNGLQQLKGRPTRPKADKKTPTVVFFVDDVGQCRGMEKKLMSHLRQWPHEEGGPIDFELVNYPKVTACKIRTLTQAFGQ